MTVTEQMFIILAVIVATLLTRCLPFLLFPAGKETPEIIRYLGKVLPAAVFGLLVVYCLRHVDVFSGSHGIPEFMGIIATVLIHCWKRQMLFSIGGGMTDASIGKVFVRAGAVAVLKGLLIGNALALLFCLIQGTTHFLPLDPENYFVSFVPVHVNLWAILAADAVAYAAILLMLWLPARMVAKIDPAKTVKAD